MDEEKRFVLAKEWLTKQKKENFVDLKLELKELQKEKTELDKLLLTTPRFQLIQRINQNERSLKRVKEELEIFQNNRQILTELKKRNTTGLLKRAREEEDDVDEEEEQKEQDEEKYEGGEVVIMDRKTLQKKKQLKKRRKAAAKQKRARKNNNNTTNQKVEEKQDEITIMEKEREEHILSKYYCTHCQSPLRARGSECKLVCHNCGINRDFIDVCCPPNFIINNNNSNNDRGVESNTYERHTHEFDLIDAFRTLDTPLDIGLDVYLSLQKLIRQHRFGVCKNVTFAKIGTYLRHFQHKQLYKFKHPIADKFNNIERPNMYEEEESSIVLPFLSLQAPYEMVKNTINDTLEYDSGKERSSFLAYSFTSFHLARFKELHHFTVHFKLLKVERCALSQNRLLAMIFYILGEPYIVHLR
jgi:Poxvirus Late Transcription Factor VLTF3 like